MYVCMYVYVTNTHYLLFYSSQVQDQLDLQCLKSAQVKERVGKETTK